MKTTTSQESLLWTSEKGPSIRIAYPVIDLLNGESMRGFGISKRRGTETGGVLLGRLTDGVLDITGALVVPCDYSQGPSYVLLGEDRTRFKAAATGAGDGSGSTPVGYFRSHTRDGLYLDGADIDLVKEAFPGATAIALVIKPYATRSAEAGFFLHQKGALSVEPALPVFRFVRGATAEPIVAAPIAPPTPPPAKVAPPAPPPVQPARNQVLTDDAPTPTPLQERLSRDADLPVGDYRSQPIFADYYGPPRPTWRTWLSLLAFGLAAVSFGAVAGYQYVKRYEPQTPAAVAPVPDAELFRIGLQAEPQGTGVLVRWNREAPAVKKALSGVLTVTEGPASKEVRLIAPELQTGTILYHNAGGDIGFRMELVLDSKNTISEILSLRLPEGKVPSVPSR